MNTCWQVFRVWSFCAGCAPQKVRDGGTPSPARGTRALPGVRAVVLALLLSLGCALGDDLSQQLESQVLAVRRDAAFQLHKLGPAAQPALPALIKALDDPDKQVWSDAIAAIANIGAGAKEAIPALLDALDSRKARGGRERDRRQAFVRSAHALSRIGPAAIPPLIAALSGADAILRAGAARALGEMGAAGKAAIPGLRANLGHREPAVRQETIDALAQIGEVAPLVSALGGKESLERSGAALALAQIGREAKDAAPALEKLLGKETDASVRAAALTALAKVSPDPAKALPQLLAALKSDNDELRHAATNALLLLRPASAALLTMLHDPNVEHARRAASLLGRLGTADAAPAIVQLALKRPEPVLIESLAQIGAPAVPALIAALDSQNPDALTQDHWLVQCLKTFGPPAIAPLSAALESKNIGARFGAARVLGEMGVQAKPAVNALLPLTADADPRVRAMALGALVAAQAEPRVLLPKLKTALSDPVPIVRVTSAQLIPYLGADGSALVPALIAAMKDDNALASKAARHALEPLVGAGLPEAADRAAREALEQAK